MHSPLFQTHEPRTLLANVNWDAGGGDNLWSNPLNWSTDTLPTSSDRVALDMPRPRTVIAAVGPIDAVITWPIARTRRQNLPLHVRRQLNLSVHQRRRNRLGLQAAIVANERDLKIAPAQRLQIARIIRQIAQDKIGFLLKPRH